MEELDELYGDANAYDFGARLYDPRIGRWFARDPLAGKYPDISPYCGYSGNPIFYVDWNGEDIVVYLTTFDGGYKQELFIIKSEIIDEEIYLNVNPTDPVSNKPLIEISKPWVIEDFDNILAEGWSLRDQLLKGKDAYMWNYSLGASQVFGGGVEFTMVYIPPGKGELESRNTLNFYWSKFAMATVPSTFSIGLSRTSGWIDYNEACGRSMDFSTFEGSAQARFYSASVMNIAGKVWQTVRSYKEGGHCLLAPFSDCGKTWMYKGKLEGQGIGIGPEFSAGVEFSIESKLLGTKRLPNMEHLDLNISTSRPSGRKAENPPKMKERTKGSNPHKLKSRQSHGPPKF